MRLKLYKGNVIVTGRKSPKSLYSDALVTFEDDRGAYDQKDAAGFIRLNALRLRTLAARDRARLRPFGLRRSPATRIARRGPRAISRRRLGARERAWHSSERIGTLAVGRNLAAELQQTDSAPHSTLRNEAKLPVARSASVSCVVQPA